MRQCSIIDQYQRHIRAYIRTLLCVAPHSVLLSVLLAVLSQLGPWVAAVSRRFRLYIATGQTDCECRVECWVLSVPVNHGMAVQLQLCNYSVYVVCMIQSCVEVVQGRCKPVELLWGECAPVGVNQCVILAGYVQCGLCVGLLVCYGWVLIYSSVFQEPC